MKRLKALLAGLALGGILGLLFAPKRGVELRESFKKDIDEGHYGVNALKNAFIGMGKDMKDFSGEVAKHEEVKEYLTKGKAAAKSVQEKALSWLEEHYGITEEDLEKAKKQVSLRAKKAKKLVGKTLNKAFVAARAAANKIRKEEE